MGDHPTKEAIMAGSYPLPSAGASTKDWSYVNENMTRPPRLQNGPFSWCRLLPGRSIAMLIRPMVKVSFCSFCHPSLFFSPTHPPPPCSTHNTKSTMLQGSTQSHITQSTLCCISYWLRTHHTNCTILYNIVHTGTTRFSD